jgi:putative ABC transport system substrate-binding protein
VITRRVFVGTLTGGLLAAPRSSEAQQPAKVARIGFLSLNLAPNSHLHEAFRQGLRDLGYIQGRNIVIEIRDAEGKYERLPALAAELVALKVDVIVTGGGTPPALAAKQATKTIPIVFASAPDPVTDGLVASLARPGGNVTGLSNINPELVGKCLEQLKQAVRWMWHSSTASSTSTPRALRSSGSSRESCGGVDLCMARNSSCGRPSPNLTTSARRSSLPESPERRKAAPSWTSSARRDFARR